MRKTLVQKHARMSSFVLHKKKKKEKRGDTVAVGLSLLSNYKFLKGFNYD